jgi:UDP-N-acetylglucosamine:LPS N-acetylglucosamine transferase
VSTYPLASQALGRLRLAGQLAAPTVAVMTDPSVHPLCVADGIDLHLAPNDDATARIRDDFGLPAVTNAPIVGPGFRPARGGEDADARHRHGLPVNGRLAVVVAGSWGVGDVEATAADVAAACETVPIVVCGRNGRLRDRLARSGRVIALGWVDDMPSLLRAADVVVHNGGGLSSLEAMACGLPVISYRCLPGHGVANAAVLLRNGLSAWPRSFADLTDALHAALDGDLRDRQQQEYRRLAGEREAAALIGDMTRQGAAT